MSKISTTARHRATPARSIVLEGLAVTAKSQARSLGRPALAVAAASGIAFGVGAPAHAGVTGPDTTENTSVQAYSAPAPAAAPAAAAGTVHTVVSGDTIGAIAAAHGVSLNDVLAANGLGLSSIDVSGRYAYANQPVLAEWNLARLAEAMLPLIDGDQEKAVAPAVEVLGGFRGQYSQAWSGGMKAKLGLSGDADSDAASALVDGAIAILKDGPVDYTLFFRNLGKAARGDLRPVRGMVLDLEAFDAWAERWQALGPDAELMDSVNPAYIPRNHLVEEALSAATDGNLAPLQQLLEAVGSPFAERPGLERYAEGAPEDFGTYMTFCGT